MHIYIYIPAHNALCEKQFTLFYVKTFKIRCCLGGFSIPNSLNLKKLWVKVHNCALLLAFVALVCCNLCMPLFSKLSPERIPLVLIFNRSLPNLHDVRTHSSYS